MQCGHIDFELTAQLPRLVVDYLKERDDMSPFYAYSPDMEGLNKRIDEVSQSAKDTSVLCQVLKEQHPAGHQAQIKNIELLEKGAAYTVTTGHQLCLFLGPVYVVHKVVSIIKLAEQIQNETGRKVVPLFWMATEDHDIAEVDHVNLFGNELEFESDYKGIASAMPLGRINSVLEELQEIMGDSELAKSLFSKIQDSYSDKNSNAEAFRSLLDSMFAHQGLIILDAQDARLKALFARQIWKECDTMALHDSMQITLSMIKNRGEKIQANPREVNLFYLDENSRYRIEQEVDGGYSARDGELSWSKEELKKEIEEKPSRFSPNVVFRPIYQEYILPNLAYIGGPGELSYWLQLKDSFHVFGASMPVLLLRDSFIYIDESSKMKMDLLGLSPKDLFRPEHTLHKEFVKRNSSDALEILNEKESILKQFDRLMSRGMGVDPGLRSFAEGEKKRLEKSLENLEKKMIRAAKKKDEKSLKDISKLLSRFLPGGKLEEREESFFALELKSQGRYLEAIMEHSDVLDPRLKVLT